ncbi:MAG: hypothetical protein GXY41_11955 [Phycisphaerae bacterium]|nr:hypothetical protein [Phycisphaerae bacterium]
MLRILYINPDVRAALDAAGVLSEAAIVQWDRGERIVHKNWADVYRWTLDGVGTVYVKRYFPQQNRLLGAFRKNLAVREFESSQRLARLGVPQAEPLLTAVAVNRFGLPRCGVYMMREVENAESLDCLLERLSAASDAALLATIADELVRLLDVMHTGAFCHWDFKPRNLLVTRTDGGVTLTPIDSRSGRPIRPFHRRACVQRDRRFLLREPLLAPLLLKRWGLPEKSGTEV